jgi:hypothetical protein
VSYVPFDDTKPAGSDTGAQVPGFINVNEKALRDAIVAGGMLKGYELSVSGGTAAQPALFYLKKNGGSVWLRGTPTWGSGAGQDGNITAMAWDLSINSGSDYTTAPGGSIGTSTFSFDSSGNLTTVTGVGGFGAWVWGLLGKVYKVVANLATHIAATGTAVHGLGTIAQQNSGAVSITGGAAVLTYEREAKGVLGNVSTSTAINWAGQGLCTMTVTGSSAALTWSNLPSGNVGYMTLDVTNGGIASALITSYKAQGGVAVSWTNPGRDICTLMCHDGATVSVIGFCKDAK